MKQLKFKLRKIICEYYKLPYKNTIIYELGHDGLGNKLVIHDNYTWRNKEDKFEKVLSIKEYEDLKILLNFPQ